MPLCIETKLTLSGETKTYCCELLQFGSGLGVLRYVIDREYDVHGVELAPGDETIAVYWEERPYTLYIWRDLAVDILVDGRGVHVLDEHELPATLDADLGRYINEAKASVLERHEDIIHDIRMYLHL
jgi:hypothetical protein